jgi:hypothetical protein
MPDTTKPFILEMDASKWAIGAMLLQKQEDEHSSNRSATDANKVTHTNHFNK